MPNYSLAINSTFNPYSFEELVKPYQMYGEAYKAVEDSYNTLGSTAGTLASVLNETRDNKSWNIYNNYMQGLNDAANELATKGLSPAARTQVGNLTKQYAQQIVPIQKAAETWQKQIEEQRKNGDSKINSYNANTLSVDDFLANPQLSYETIDREALKKESATYFSQIAKRAGDIVANKARDAKGNYTYYMDFVQKTGATPEEVLAFQDDMLAAMKTGDINAVYAVANAHPELGNIFNDIFRSTKAVNWDPNSEGTSEVLNTILEGSLASIGETTHNLQQDAVGTHAANNANDYKYWKQRLDDTQAAEEAKNNNKPTNTTGLNKINKNVLNVIDPMSKEAKQYVKSGHFIDTNGTLSYNSNKDIEISKLANQIKSKYNLTDADLNLIMNAPLSTKTSGINDEYYKKNKLAFERLKNKGLVIDSGGYGKTFSNSDISTLQSKAIKQKEFQNYLTKSLNIPEEAFEINAESVNALNTGPHFPGSKPIPSLPWKGDYTEMSYNMPYIGVINDFLKNSDEGKNIYSNYEYEYKIDDSDVKSVVKQMSRNLPNGANFELIELTNNKDKISFKTKSIYPSEIKEGNKEGGYKPLSVCGVYTDKGPVVYVKCETKDHKKVLVRVRDDKMENNIETIARTQGAVKRAFQEGNQNAFDSGNNDLKQYESDFQQTVANWYLENKATEQTFKPLVDY